MGETEDRRQDHADAMAHLRQLELQLAEVAGLVLAAWGTVPAQAVAVDPTLVARVHGQSVRLPSAHSLPADGEADKQPGPFGY